MLSFKAYVVELHGKGSLKAIEKHHGEMSQPNKTKRRSAASEYHVTQRDRANRLRALANGRVPEYNKKMNHEFDHADSKRAKAAKANIKSSDYK